IDNYATNHRSMFVFFSSRRRHTISKRDWSSDVCSSDLSNLFGDIMTDIGAALAGGMGLAAGANINPERTYPSMFEPVHGSAPDIAGEMKSNPLAAIWSVSQMFDFFGYENRGKEILTAIESIMVEGKVLTPDLGGTARTNEVGDRIIELLSE